MVMQLMLSLPLRIVRPFKDAASLKMSFVKTKHGPCVCDMKLNTHQVEIARHAPKSPVIVGTKPNSAIADNADTPIGVHAYAVMWATMVDGKQK